MIYLGPLHIIDRILESVMIFIMTLFLTVCQGIPDRGSTAHYGLPQISVSGTSHVFLCFDQVLLHLSNSVKVFYIETWTTGCV